MIQNLKYLLLIRLFAIGGQVLAFFFMQYFFAIRLPVVPISIIIAVLGLFTFFSWQYIHRSPVLSQKTFLIQLLADLVALSLLIYFTGGSINPFISLFIIPIIFAAASLKTTYTWIIAIIALTCYTTLMFFHVPLTHQHHHGDHMDLHIWGMWYGFILSALLVAYFVSRIAKTLRERDRKLAAIREEQLHAEQILALGTLAAGTAHELGTPLSTMAVLAKELEHDYADNSELSENLGLIRQQIDRCKSILARMAIDAGELQAESGYRTVLVDYLTRLVDDWNNTRQDVEVYINLKNGQSGPLIIADHTLTHALVNVLNNAADATANRVDIEADWNKDNLIIKIHDDGHGIDREILNNLGKTIVTSKTQSNGMGLGLFLAQTTFNRYGGSMQLNNQAEGGATVTITLPLSSIIAD
jgi:two-component system sensor histidine kinase RegB